jgi:hypothetical protein
MILTYRLVHLVETHSDPLASRLLEKTRNSPFLPGYRDVPPDELRQRVYEIYRHLGDWLLGKNEADIENRYAEIGERRARQHVPLSQLIWAIMLTKDNLWEFVQQEAVLDRPVEVFSEFELLQLTNQFFDRAIYYAAVGYERSRVSEPASKASAVA